MAATRRTRQTRPISCARQLIPHTRLQREARLGRSDAASFSTEAVLRCTHQSACVRTELRCQFHPRETDDRPGSWPWLQPRPLVSPSSHRESRGRSERCFEVKRNVQKVFAWVQGKAGNQNDASVLKKNKHALFKTGQNCREGSVKVP